MNTDTEHDNNHSDTSDGRTSMWRTVELPHGTQLVEGDLVGDDQRARLREIVHQNEMNRRASERLAHTTFI